MKVWIDQDLCTGDGLCEEIAPDVFTLLDDGLAYVREGDKIYAAAKGNPQGAEGMASFPDSKLDAVDRAEYDVGEDDIDVVGLEQCQRCRSVVRDVHLEVLAAEDVGRKAGDRLVVVDDEHRAGAGLHWRKGTCDVELLQPGTLIGCRFS